MQWAFTVAALLVATAVGATTLGEVEAARELLVEPINAAAGHPDPAAAQRTCVELRVPAAEFETAAQGFRGDPDLKRMLLGEALALRRAVDACALGAMRDFAHELLRWQAQHDVAMTRARELALIE